MAAGLTIAVIGGGRWAKVLVGVLAELLSSDDRIVWVSRHNTEACLGHVREKNLTSVMTVVPEISDFSVIDAALIANSTRDHARTALELLGYSIPVLIEKPFAITCDELARLMSAAKGTIAGVNLEYMFAEYLSVFKRHLADVSIKDISVAWTDPLNENRYGAIKKPDYSVTVMHDAFPHCWSILRTLWPDTEMILSGRIQYDLPDGAVHWDTETRAGQPCSISLSRRGNERVRRIEVNGGQYVLDFSAEPGFVEINGVRHDNPPFVKRPLASSLMSFLDVVRQPSLAADWRLALSACSRVVDLSIESDRMLRAEMSRMIVDINEEDLKSAGSQFILTDYFTPLFSDRGQVIFFDTDEQRGDFIRHMFPKFRGHSLDAI